LFKILRKEKITTDEYIAALDKCKQIAEKESNDFEDRIKKVKKILDENRNCLLEFITLSEQNADFCDKELVQNLSALSLKIDSELQNGMKHIEQSFLKKKKSLSFFTVTLFGRTKAGKSTIREALTNGDGSSIGKGDQRTTRDIKEYKWNRLRIIDTPGIAAYQGEEDVEVAESVIDESDVILFLVTNDSIQESEFSKLVELKTQNKPVVILLNVKVDIEQRVRLKRFLNSYDEIVSHRGQEGNIERIKELSKRYLGYDDIEIIPIHALSAYLSSCESDEEMKQALYNASRVHSVKMLMRQLVINQGIQKRTLTFRDDYIFYITSLESVFWEYYKKIKPRVRYIKGKQLQVDRWFQDFSVRGIQEIDRRVKEYFSILYAEVPNFIDDFAGNKSADAEWEKILDKLKIEEKCQTISYDIIDEVKRYLDEFSKQLNFELGNIDFENDLSDIGKLKKGVIGRVARWGAAGLGLGEGVLAIGIALNWWNPAGWIMGAIGAGGLLLGIFSMIFGDDSKRLEKEKLKAKKELIKNIEVREETVKKQLRKWFDKNILQQLRQQVQIELNAAILKMEEYTNIIQSGANSLADLSLKENKRLFSDIYRQTFNSSINDQVIAVAREQGKQLKVLVNGHNEVLASYHGRKRMEKVFGERIVYVEFTNDPIELFKRAIFPGKTDNVSMDFNSEKLTLNIQAGKDTIGSIIGKGGTNIKMASRLLGIRINVVEV